MYSGYGRLSVCLSVPRCIPTLLQAPTCNFGHGSLPLCEVAARHIECIALSQQSYSMLGPVSNGMGDHLSGHTIPASLPSHLGQLSLLCSVGLEMSAGQMVLMLGKMAHSTCG